MTRFYLFLCLRVNVYPRTEGILFVNVCCVRQDESMHSGAAVDAFQAALNRDIEGDAQAVSQTSESDAGILHCKHRCLAFINRSCIGNKYTHAFR